MPKTVFSMTLSAKSRVATSLDLDLAFGAVDVNVDLACTSLPSPLLPLSPPNRLSSSFCYCWGAHQVFTIIFFV